MSSFNNMAQNVTKKIVNYKTVMEKTLDKIKTERRKPAENLVEQMRESKLIDESKLSDLKLKAWTSFKDLSVRRSVDVSNFKVAFRKFAAEQNSRLLDWTVACAIKGEKVLGALGAAASAFMEAMKK